MRITILLTFAIYLLLPSSAYCIEQSIPATPIPTPGPAIDTKCGYMDFPAHPSQLIYLTAEDIANAGGEQQALKNAIAAYCKEQGPGGSNRKHWTSCPLTKGKKGACAKNSSCCFSSEQYSCTGSATPYDCGNVVCYNVTFTLLFRCQYGCKLGDCPKVVPVDGVGGSTELQGECY